MDRLVKISHRWGRNNDRRGHDRRGVTMPKWTRKTSWRPWGACGRPDRRSGWPADDRTVCAGKQFSLLSGKCGDPPRPIHSVTSRSGSPMSKRMQGKVCVISGGAGSIGVATAKLLLQEGAKVMLMDLSEAALKRAAAEIGGDCVAWSVSDVTKSDQIRSFVEATVNKWGNIDMLLSNAGNFGIAAPVTEYPEDIFDSVIAVHVKGAFLTAKHVLPHMNDGGSIIITSSIVG